MKIKLSLKNNIKLLLYIIDSSSGTIFLFALPPANPMRGFALASLDRTMFCSRASPAFPNYRNFHSALRLVSTRCRKSWAAHGC
jgi:hypothetical protein